MYMAEITFRNGKVQFISGETTESVLHDAMDAAEENGTEIKNIDFGVTFANKTMYVRNWAASVVDCLRIF